MNQKRIFIGVFAVLAIGILLWWWLSFPKTIPTAEKPERTSSSTQTQSTSSAPTPKPPIEERRKEVVEKILGVLATPITFYGKVVDQNGDPVPDANVGYTALDKFNASGSHYTGKSDLNGFFEISEIKGAALTVGVGKEGYYPIDGKSTGAFAYGIGPDSNSKPPPTKENPAIFVLHKMGETEPLIKNEIGTRIPKDGTPVNVSLETGRVSPQGDIQIEAWTEDDKQDAQRHYNWRCRVSIPNGGLSERKGQFAFEAPENGYQSADEIVMPQTAERWQPQAQKEYFIKLNDGRYARISFLMIAQGNHYFQIESYLNPKSGSRNLEFDPNKVVKSQ